MIVLWKKHLDDVGTLRVRSKIVTIDSMVGDRGGLDGRTLVSAITGASGRLQTRPNSTLSSLSAVIFYR